ncbi:MAG TPA: response regulator transcription factor [Dongiaceae bacterium]|jgi:two-component system phosphate regulon response regulator OmpR|nr:response regulator transcription factor [Dongiaceae bacterium]
MSEAQPHILVIDDDKRLRDLIARYLTEQGYRVTTAIHAADARAKLAGITFDMLVVDIMMPGESGLELTQSLRENSLVPILLLTAMGESNDRIAGLETGADDYLVKPFEPRELVLRISAILKRARARTERQTSVGAVKFGAFVFEIERRRLFKAGEPVHLTEAESELLFQLARRAGEPVSRESLAPQAEETGESRLIDVQMTRLRRKIEDDPRFPRFLQTVRGRGYVLQPD